MDNPKIVFALQGGGALGAYQAGAFQGLVEHGIQLDWIVGSSIGAINGAIIAGNPPQHRVECLRAFWEHLAQDGPGGYLFPPIADWPLPWLSSAGLMDII